MRVSFLELERQVHFRDAQMPSFQQGGDGRWPFVAGARPIRSVLNTTLYAGEKMCRAGASLLAGQEDGVSLVLNGAYDSFLLHFCCIRARERGRTVPDFADHAVIAVSRIHSNVI